MQSLNPTKVVEINKNSFFNNKNATMLFHHSSPDINFWNDSQPGSYPIPEISL